MFYHKKLFVALLGLALPAINACGSVKKAMKENEGASVHHTTSQPTTVLTEEEVKGRHALTRDLSDLHMLHSAIETAIGYQAERQALQHIREEIEQIHQKTDYQSLRTFVLQTPFTPLAVEACSLLIKRYKENKAVETIKVLFESGHQEVLQAALQNNYLAGELMIVDNAIEQSRIADRTE